MNRLLTISGVIVMLISVFLPLGGPTTPLSSTCLQSAVNPYVIGQATICPPPQTYIDNALYTTSPNSASGFWSGSQLTTQGGFLKVYYFLGSGLSIQSYSLTYNYCQNGCTALTQITGLTTGTDAGSGLTWVGVVVPNAALPTGVQTDFRMTLTDTSGATNVKDFFFTYIGSSATTYTETFQIQDYTNYQSTGATGPLPNVQIIITSGSQTVGQIVTNGGGTASIQLPGAIVGQTTGQYVASPTTPANYYVLAPQSFMAGQQPSTLYWQAFRGPACAYSGQINCYPACGPNGANSMGLSYVNPCGNPCGGTTQTLTFASSVTCSASTSTTYSVGICTTAGQQNCITTTSVTCLYGGTYPNCNSYSTSFSIGTICLTNIISTTTVVGGTTTIIAPTQTCSAPPTGGGGGAGTLGLANIVLFVTGAFVTAFGVTRKKRG